MATYTFTFPAYPISLSFNVDNLYTNIKRSTIAPFLSSNSLTATVLTLNFASSLSAGEITILNGLVTNNDTIITRISTRFDAQPINAVCATLANATLSTGYVEGTVIDGYTLVRKDVILIKNQTNGIENGVYMVNTSGAPTRFGVLTLTNFANGFIYVNKGFINANTIWVCTNAYGSDRTDIDALTFVKNIPEGLKVYGKIYLPLSVVYGFPTLSTTYAGAVPVLIPVGPVTLISNGDFDSPSAGRLRYIGNYTGIFVVNVAFSLAKGTGPSANVQFNMFLNGVSIPHHHFYTSLDGNTVYKTVTSQSFVSLAKNDYLELYVTATDAAFNLTIQSFEIAVSD